MFCGRSVKKIVLLAQIIMGVLVLLACQQYSMCLAEETGAIDLINIDKIIADTPLLSDMQRLQLSNLTDGNLLIDIEIEPERIILQFAQGEGTMLRLAVWDDPANNYYSIDTDMLPAETYLDTYHDDKDSIFISISTGDDEDCEDDGDYEEYFLCFERIDDLWLLTSFTDGYSFQATCGEGQIVFEDYYDDSDEFVMSTEGIFAFEGFALSDLFPSIDEYNSLFSDRPSLMEWEDEE